MAVLICLIFSVLSTIDQYVDFANETLFWMVSTKHSCLLLVTNVCCAVRLKILENKFYLLQKTLIASQFTKASLAKGSVWCQT